jgi:light-regulated signal transduction histidine kinase (bacteriophytochrome)
VTTEVGRLGIPAAGDDEFSLPPPSATPSQLGDTDVTACDREPIHIPGSVQPHGALLSLDEATLTIRQVSANVAEFVGIEPRQLIGSPLVTALGSDAAEIVVEALRATPEGRVGPLLLDLVGVSGGADVVRECDLTLHRCVSGRLVLEIEHTVADGSASATGVPAALLRLQATPDLPSLLHQTVAEVADLTGFDRIMFYRFNGEGDGEVVAEEVTRGQESYLGLHYPGSDIPRQARELYRRQWLRLIVSSDYVPAPLVPELDPDTGQPLDLSYAALRSVSPVHLQYLRNMGVGASMSMSIVVDDQLWGLLLCHAADVHFVPSAIRTACEQLAQFVSMQVESRWLTARLMADLRQQHLRARLMDQIDEPVPAAGLVGTIELRDVVAADAAVGRLVGTTVRAGDLIDTGTADELVALLRRVSGSVGFTTSSVRRDLPEAAALLDGAGFPSVAGLLLAPGFGEDDSNYLLWLRREVEQTVDWAGEPTVKHQSGMLSPRASFALWREKVRDQSEPWHAGDVTAAATLAEAVANRLNRLHEMSLAAAAARTEELFQREHEIADALQRGMLPVLPEIEGLGLSAAYVTASATAEVGGDWYDVFTLPDGSTGVAMGDVTGHDLSAAAAMGQLRSVLRSYAWEETEPARVLDKLDALVSGFAMRHLATVFFARVQADSADPDSYLLRYANAGHLPPVLRLPDGEVEVLAEGLSVLIGVDAGIEHENAERRISAGSTLLLYTDGLVEQRDRGVEEGIAALRAVVADGPADPDALREHVLTQMVPGRREDDIAVLVVRFED